MCRCNARMIVWLQSMMLHRGGHPCVWSSANKRKETSSCWNRTFALPAREPEDSEEMKNSPLGEEYFLSSSSIRSSMRKKFERTLSLQAEVNVVWQRRDGPNRTAPFLIWGSLGTRGTHKQERERTSSSLPIPATEIRASEWVMEIVDGVGGPPNGARVGRMRRSC